MKLEPRDFRLPGGLQIFVKGVDGTTYTFDVQHETTILEVKQMVSGRVNIPSANIELLFANRRLADNQTLSDYCIQMETTLMMIVRMHEICLLVVTASHQHLAVRVQASATVFEVKREISKRTQVAHQQFQLIYNGEALDETRKIDELGLGDRSELRLVVIAEGGLTKGRTVKGR